MCRAYLFDYIQSGKARGRLYGDTFPNYPCAIKLLHFQCSWHCEKVVPWHGYEHFFTSDFDLKDENFFEIRKNYFDENLHQPTSDKKFIGMPDQCERIIFRGEKRFNFK